MRVPGWGISILTDSPIRLRRIVLLVEAKEYSAVGRSRRYLAAQRRLTWRVSRAAMLVVAGAAPAHFVILSLLHPTGAGFLLLLNAAVGILALAAWWALGHRLRQRAELVAFAVSIVVLIGIIAMALDGPRLVALSFADLMFLPVLVTLVIPWRTWTEIRWLAAYAVAGALLLLFVPAASSYHARASSTGWRRSARALERHELAPRVLIPESRKPEPPEPYGDDLPF